MDSWVFLVLLVVGMAFPVWLYLRVERHFYERKLALIKARLERQAKRKTQAQGKEKSD